MTKHTKSIIIFGMVIPCLLIVALIGGALQAKASIQEKRETKSVSFQDYERKQTESQLIDAKLTKDDRREKMAYWSNQLREELIQSVSKNLNEIMSDYDERQLRRTSFSRPTGRSQIAGSVESEHARLVLGFEGGLGPLQTTLTELEILMPHLTLESLNIIPNNRQSGGTFLRFEVTYVAWAPLKA